MSVDIQIVHSVKEIGKEAWDRLSYGRPFASYRWYHYGETVLAGYMTPVYIVLAHAGEPIARATFWISRQEHLPISSRTVRRLMETALRRWPLLICRSPLTSTTGLILPKEPSLREAALEAIVQAAYGQMQQYKASFLIIGYMDERQAEEVNLSNVLIPATLPDPGTRLVITWPNFESYLGHLSKSVRKDYRRHRNRAADLGIEVRHHWVESPLEKTVLDEAIVLIRNAENHHNLSPSPWARAVLENAHLVDAIWLTAETENRLVGCGLLFGDKGTWGLASLGLDYETRYAYFQLVYTALRCAIEEEDIQVLLGGSEVYKMKQQLGFQIEDTNHLAFAGGGPLLHRLGQWMVGARKAGENGVG